MAYKYAEYGPPAIRLGIGILFITSGVLKLLNPAGVTGFLQSLGFPGAAFWAWLLLLSEILFGLAVLIGFKVRWTVWPLVVVMLVAMATVVIPNTTAMNAATLNFHILTVLALVSLFLTGPGALAVDKDTD